MAAWPGEYHLDLYPADDPRDGTRLVRFSADDSLQAVDYRDVIGVGSGQFKLRGNRSEAAFLDPDGEQYVRVVRDDGSTELVVGGFWTNQIKYGAALANETKPLEVGGAGTMAYLARSVMAPHTYIHAVFTGQDPFDRIWRLWNQGDPAGGDFLGAVLWRVIYEAQHFRSGSSTYTHRHIDGETYTDNHDDDRRRSAIPDLVMGFDQFEDSDGNAWTLPSGNFTASVGENVLQVVRRLMEGGLYVEMDPDTFELRAWEGTDHRRDRTGGAWGTNVVRLQTPTDATIATGNVKSDSERLITSHIRRSTIWAGGTDDTYGFADTSSTRPWEGYVPSDAASTTPLDNLAATQMQARSDAGDVLTARLKLGQTPTQGKYLPFEHVRLDDLVTVHTGSGDWDYDEASYPVGALRIHLREGGDWDAWVDLGASFEAMERRQFEVGAASAHTHPPNPQLCTPGHSGSSSATRLYFSQDVHSIDPALSGDWEQDARDEGGEARTLKTTPDASYGSGVLSDTAGGTAGGRDVCLWQGLYGPLSSAEAASIAAGGATITGQWLTKARHGIGISEAAQDMISQIGVRVTQGATTTIRGTALALHTLASSAGSNKWGAWNPPQNKSFPPAASSLQTLSAVPGCAAGDYLVFELGKRSYTTATSGSSIAIPSNAASDLPEDESTTTALNAWIQFTTSGVGAVVGDLPLDTVHQDEESVGTSVRAARCDHQHAHGLLSADGLDYHDFPEPTDILSDDTPLVEADDGDPGVSESASRSDHVHPELPLDTSQRWEAVTNGEDIFVWEGDDLVHEWKAY